jgi:hypothetical protein
VDRRPIVEELRDRLHSAQIEALRRARRRSLIVIAVAASILVLLIYLLQRMPAVVDLGAYLAPVKAASLDDQPIPGFQAVNVTNEPRLEGYQAVKKYRRDVLEQTVYDRPNGARIVLLSAPARTDFRYGMDQGVKTEVAGIRCEMLDSPTLKTYAFFAGGRHYVLICKACTREEAGNIMRQLGASL